MGNFLLQMAGLSNFKVARSTCAITYSDIPRWKPAGEFFQVLYMVKNWALKTYSMNIPLLNRQLELLMIKYEENIKKITVKLRSAVYFRHIFRSDKYRLIQVIME